eukprot:1160429-Pelagomonas_calceolata.AAC.5
MLLLRGISHPHLVLPARFSVLTSPPGQSSNLAIKSGQQTPASSARCLQGTHPQLCMQNQMFNPPRTPASSARCSQGTHPQLCMQNQIFNPPSAPAAAPGAEKMMLSAVCVSQAKHETHHSGPAHPSSRARCVTKRGPPRSLSSTKWDMKACRAVWRDAGSSGVLVARTSSRQSSAANAMARESCSECAHARTCVYVCVCVCVCV